ncbi:hypothetical protein [Sedimenticola thiotaurini]|uniref:Uncharacterized protein n=1 Tax=Sedimenticola thiotaurini TaxID=1543721 RepID=A0A0F7JVL6_9GAMM|nr:hypothetical protein [Sedimenticola thiotaurini]AKH19384.1 hypothetical protein AAY24_02380 [Sedimenticola thiotaurini]
MDWVPDHLRLFIVVGGLLLLLLLVGSLVQKYEEYTAAKRLAVQRLMLGIQRIEDALEKSRTGGLPAGVGKLLRNELLARYITVRQVYPQQPNIHQMIVQAEERARLEPEGATSVNSNAFTSAESLNRYIKGLNEIYGLLEGRRLGTRLVAADRNAMQLKLVEFQLMAASSYYTREVTAYAQSNDWPNAIRAARALDSFMMTRPRSSPTAVRLRNESRELLQAVSELRMPGGQTASDNQQDA